MKKYFFISFLILCSCGMEYEPDSIERVLTLPDDFFECQVKNRDDLGREIDEYGNYCFPGCCECGKIC